MRSHPQIISDAGAEAVADLVGVSVHTVRSWGQRERIPSEHWKALVDAGHAQPDELIAAAAANPRKRPTATDAPAEARAA